MLRIIEKSYHEGISTVYPSNKEVVAVGLVHKPCDWEDLLSKSSYKVYDKVKCEVQEVNYFDAATWAKFKNNMSIKVRGWSNCGGKLAGGLTGVIKCVPPQSTRNKPVYVNPEGYDYARYAGFAIQ